MQNSAVVDPGVALLVFVALAVLFVATAWPKRGLAARLLRLARSNERIRMEDALKHLNALEYRGRRATIESLAGALEISRIVAARTVQRLTERGLAVVRDETPVLTEEGREYALRILRTHRLWERYLADRTGVRPEEWHTAAEEAEHRVTSAQADALAARLGHPRYDPHGDPIPTRTGEMPPLAGTALSTIAPGAQVVVTHLEDEPPELFERLTAIGFSPHLRFTVLARDRESVVIELKGEEVTLPLILAGNVTARTLAEDEVVHAASATLADLKPGDTARVLRIAAHCQGPQRRRLLDLGVVPDTEITAELESAGGDPMAYRIRGALIALRAEQASWIEVEPTESPTARPIDAPLESVA